MSGRLLGGAGRAERTALIARDGTVSYRELTDLVAARAGEIELPFRSVVTLSGDHSIDFVVAYLALLEAGHVPLLARDHAEPLTREWQVGGTALAAADDVRIEATGAEPIELHPDLALLMSTSGSTGSPKLVRLSHRNLVSNAEAIAEFQRLTEQDRGITSLPLHYCFGLSVLHSHLVAGASVVLTDNSVVDRCFHTAVREHGVTNLAGVPHTYEMLERSEPEALGDTSLRLLTQAGGRLASDSVARWADRTQRWGAEFMVMYGQTEATARMSYLPPELVTRHPGAIGRPVPGGSIELRPTDGQPDGVGEIVYRGPNVMMGYARERVDLGLGPTLDELATGDLARYVPSDDVYEIVGRKSRFIKPFGLRIDIDRVESELRSEFAGELAAAGDDERLVVFAPGADTDRVATSLRRATGLPAHAAHVLDRAIPMTASGKPDQAAMLAADTDATCQQETVAVGVAGSVEGAFATVFGRAVRPDDTFVSLGGDSLSFVECSIRLESALGTLPRDWHLMTVASLAAFSAPKRRLARLDTTVVLRAIGICLVVATHMRVEYVPGGAHTLLAVAGYNLARFMTPLESPVERIRAGLRTAGRAAVPTIVWVTVGMLVFGSYSVGTLLLVNNYVGPASHSEDHWHFWFIEVFVHLVLLATLVAAVPFVQRLDRRFAYLLPLAVLGATLLFRLDWADMGQWYNMRYRTHSVAFFFVLGWLIQRSTTWRLRAITTVVAIGSIIGYFDLPSREWRIIALLVVLVWARQLPVPRWSVRVIGTVAAASMWIYVSHFAIWPVYRSVLDREIAYVLTIASGVAVWFTAERIVGLLNTWRQARSTRPTIVRITPRFIPRTPLRGTP